MVQICFNTVAALFLLDIDNLSYEHGLSQRTKNWMGDLGKIRLSKADETVLHRSKVIHVVLITLTLVASVRLSEKVSGWTSIGSGEFVYFLMPCVLFVGAVLEAFAPGATVCQAFCTILKAIIGLALSVMFVIVAFIVYYQSAGDALAGE